jgi:hypothetical protein
LLFWLSSFSKELNLKSKTVFPSEAAKKQKEHYSSPLPLPSCQIWWKLKFLKIQKKRILKVS